MKSAFWKMVGRGQGSNQEEEPDEQIQGEAPEGEEVQFDENNLDAGYVPESERQSFLTFLKKAMGGLDLSKITAPAFILAPMSMMETNADLMCHPDDFSSIPLQTDPVQRMIMMTKWYISRYHKQTSLGSGKKPYNPVLGEQFLCKWSSQKLGDITLISEQVSHHPPVLAEYYENAKQGIVNMGHYELKSGFSGTVVKAKVIANNVTTVVKYNENYVSTFPTFVIRGFLVASPFFDLVGEASITCAESGYKCIIEYKDKPWFRGEYHLLSGRIVKITDEQNPLYTFAGNWKKEIWITNEKTGEKKLLYTTDQPIIEREVKPVPEQSPMESQKVWHDVTVALKKQDYRAAGEAKTIIEEHQRKLRAERAEKNETYEPALFYWNEAESRWVYRQLETRVKELASQLKK